MFGRHMRLRRYLRQYEALSPSATDSQNVATQLAAFWKGVRLRDVLSMPNDVRGVATLTVWFPNLEQLVKELKLHNDLIAEQDDGGLESRNRKTIQERTTVILDFYFADANHYPVDETHLLRRLQGLLQEHSYLVDQYEGHYYQRLSERFYDDVIALTQTLLDANRPKESP